MHSLSLDICEIIFMIFSFLFDQPTPPTELQPQNISIHSSASRTYQPARNPSYSCQECGQCAVSSDVFKTYLVCLILLDIQLMSRPFYVCRWVGGPQNRSVSRCPLSPTNHPPGLIFSTSSTSAEGRKTIENSFRVRV